MPDAEDSPPLTAINLDNIKAPAQVPAVPDKQTKEELDSEEKRTRIEGLKQDIRERKKYAFRVFVLAVGWLLGIFGLLVCQGFRVLDFHLAENVLLAAISSTTANIIGVLIVIMKYLFSGSDKR